MSRSAIIEKLESQQIKKDIPTFRIGDTVRVHIRIIEGDKERLQVFTGTVIARKGADFLRHFLCIVLRMVKAWSVYSCYIVHVLRKLKW